MAGTERAQGLPVDAERVLTTPYVGPLMRHVRALAADQGGVVSRRQLYALGVTRWMVVANVRAHRWRRIGDQSICVHTGPMTPVGDWWAAVFQGGPRAFLDGASALEAAGLQHYSSLRVRVSVPRGAKVRRNRRYDIRQTRRWSADDVAPHRDPPQPTGDRRYQGRPVGGDGPAGDVPAHPDRPAGPRPA